MKALKYIFFLLLIVIIAIAIYIAVQPNDYSVTRTRTIKAPAAVIYENVNDYKNWASWSSWSEKDPNIKITLPEDTSGLEGSYSWEDADGVGTIKTIEVNPNKAIEQEVQINDYPKSKVTWKFNPNEDGSTDVTRTISGEDLPFGFKFATLLNGSMEEQIGPEYERSLEKLDSIVLADMRKYSIIVDKTPTQHSGGFYVYNSTATTFEDFPSKMEKMLPEVMNYAKKNNITIAGAPFVLYHQWDEANNAVMFSCCIPTASRVITTGSDILTGQIEPFKALKVTLTGDYANLKEAWETGMEAIEESSLEQDEDGPMIEAYLNTPMETPNPANLKTEIYIAVK
jgi:effector-binding domain-containing protein/uncharacterized protein YndB with AHSA1/START domain